MHTPMLSRAELEAEWRVRVQRARARYEEHAAITAALVAERLTRPVPDPEGAYAASIASMRELEALREYRRVLGVFTDLVVRGIVPDEKAS